MASLGAIADGLWLQVRCSPTVHRGSFTLACNSSTPWVATFEIVVSQIKAATSAPWSSELVLSPSVSDLVYFEDEWPVSELQRRASAAGLM